MQLIKVLPILGTIPFVVCAGLFSVGVTQIPVLGSVVDIYVSYLLVIVSFMAGVHWGFYLVPAHRIRLNLFFLSNVFTLLAWFSYLWFALSVQLIVCALVLGLLLIIDYGLFKKQLISVEYFSTRKSATAIVGVTLLIMIAFTFLS